MTLQTIAIILGLLAMVGGMATILRPQAIRKGIEAFPRSVAPAWIMTALCCLLGAKYALEMNMGFLNEYKRAIYFIAPAVFIASVTYMKELLAPRSLGGLLLLLAVPILQTARWHESPWRLVVVSVVYIWIIYGIVLLMSPWYFRKWCAPFMAKERLLKVAAGVKVAIGLFILLLGIFVY